MKEPDPKNLTSFQKKLHWRKVRMYVMLALTFIACLVVSVSSYHRRFFDAIDPQIRSAYSKIASLMPAIEEDERSLIATSQALVRSREAVGKMGITLSGDTMTGKLSVESILEDSPAVERIARMTVGHNGIVAVAAKDTGAIVIHPDKGEIGKTMMVFPFNKQDFISVEKGALFTSVVNLKDISGLDLNSFTDAAAAQNIRFRHLLIVPGNGNVKLSSTLGSMVFGTIVPYGSFYIVCGISMWEYLYYIFQAVVFSALACVVLWLFVHYISLMLSKHELNGKDLCRKLIAYSLVLTFALFGVSWYLQVLDSVTSDLIAMQFYAESGVSAMSTFQESRQRINDWFDEQYLIQCRIARDYVKTRGKENITRKDLAELSNLLGVRHVYIYDPQGKVLVTNSNYDHFKLSEDASAPSHAFLPLLEGADHVILPPMPDEISGARTQLIGVSLRSDEDLADGFVQISIDPALRDYLTQSLGTDSVLADMTVGMPNDAIAVDKGDLTISATTGFGYIGQSLEDYGYNAEKLKTTRSGYLRHNGKIYYAGFGETEKVYVIPVATRVSRNAPVRIALRITLILLAGQALILLMALYRYQTDVVEAAPPPEPAAEPEVGEADKKSKKSDFDKRWHMDRIKSDLTPGERVRAIAFKLLLGFCVVTLVPLIFLSLSRDSTSLIGMSYVLYGNWEKGLNIFAFTSCLLLLLVLYVFVTLANRALYSMARVSDLRMETIYLLLRSSLKYVCVIAFIYYGLSQFGIPTQALLASAGIITLAISVGAKDMVVDIIAGFFILLEGNLKVGDYVTIGGWFGSVQEIGLRTTKVSFHQDTKIFNNSSVKDLINCDQPVALVKLKLPVALKADLAELEKILEAELPSLMEDCPDMISAPRYGGLDSFTEKCMFIMITFEAKNGPHLRLSREMYRRMKLMLDRHGIWTTDAFWPPKNN